jgi:hypothetical protein
VHFFHVHSFHIDIFTYIHTYTHTYIQDTLRQGLRFLPYIYIYTHMYIYIYIHIHTYTQVTSPTRSDKVFTFYSTGLSWPNARLQCQSLGGDLATITSLQENNAIVGAGFPSGSFWIGESMHMCTHMYFVAYQHLQDS